MIERLHRVAMVGERMVQMQRVEARGIHLGLDRRWALPSVGRSGNSCEAYGAIPRVGSVSQSMPCIRSAQRELDETGGSYAG